MAQAAETMVTLQVRPLDDQRFAVDGLLAADDQEHWRGALVTVRQAGEIAATATLDENGGFTCAPLAAGSLELRITPERGSALVLPDVALA